MMLSVIIPTRNRAALLGRVLESLTEQQQAPEFEVLVVDNGSTDDTPAVCEAFRSRLPIERVAEPRPGLHAARHAGLARARGEILVYTDDDVRGFPTWLAGHARSFEHPQVWLAGGRCVPDWEDPPPSWLEAMWADLSGGRVLTHLSLIDLGDNRRIVSPVYVFGCNFAIRRKRLLEIGGFHPDGMPQELLHLRGDGETAVSQEVELRGGLAWYDPEASVHHWVPRERMTLEYLEQRGFAQGISDAFTLIRRRGDVAAGTLARGAWRFARQTTRVRPVIRDLLRSPAAARAKRALNRSYWRGFFAHLARARQDSELRAWILRRDYIDV